MNLRAAAQPIGVGKTPTELRGRDDGADRAVWRFSNRSRYRPLPRVNLNQQTIMSIFYRYRAHIAGRLAAAAALTAIGVLATAASTGCSTNANAAERSVA